jgi:hypothetical protein
MSIGKSASYYVYYLLIYTRILLEPTYPFCSPKSLEIYTTPSSFLSSETVILILIGVCCLYMNSFIFQFSVPT